MFSDRLVQVEPEGMVRLTFFASKDARMWCLRCLSQVKHFLQSVTTQMKDR